MDSRIFNLSASLTSNLMALLLAMANFLAKEGISVSLKTYAGVLKE
jgi:hypothetical protein